MLRESAYTWRIRPAVHPHVQLAAPEPGPDAGTVTRSFTSPSPDDDMNADPFPPTFTSSSPGLAA
jgi:hypothetical protein